MFATLQSAGAGGSALAAVNGIVQGSGAVVAAGTVASIYVRGEAGDERKRKGKWMKTKTRPKSSLGTRPPRRTISPPRQFDKQGPNQSDTPGDGSTEEGERGGRIHEWL